MAIIQEVVQSEPPFILLRSITLVSFDNSSQVIHPNPFLNLIIGMQDDKHYRLTISDRLKILKSTVKLPLPPTICPKSHVQSTFFGDPTTRSMTISYDFKKKEPFTNK